MPKTTNDTKTLLWGVVIGGLIGGGALYLLKGSHEAKKPALKKLGKAISDVGEMLEESCIDNNDDAMEEIGKTIPKEDNALKNVLNWAATGIHLWKKLKGM